MSYASLPHLQGSQESIATGSWSAGFMVLTATLLNIGKKMRRHSWSWFAKMARSALSTASKPSYYSSLGATQSRLSSHPLSWNWSSVTKSSSKMNSSLSGMDARRSSINLVSSTTARLRRPSVQQSNSSSNGSSKYLIIYNDNAPMPTGRHKGEFAYSRTALPIMPS